MLAFLEIFIKVCCKCSGEIIFNMDENVHRYAVRERKREKGKKREKKTMENAVFC